MRKTLAATALACLAALPGWAQGYFEGKTVTYIIATNPGGNYDAYGRLIGRHLEEELGADKLIFKNLPGAGHIIGANTLFASKPDGLTIGTFNTGLIYAQILQRGGIKFDLSEFSWIGKAAADPRVMVLSTNSGFESFEDLAGADGQVRFAASGIGSASFTETKMLADGKRHREEKGESLMVPRWDIVPIPEHLRGGLAPDSIMEFPAETAQSMFDFRANEVVGNIAPRPLLLFHSANDSVTPTEQSIGLFEHARQPTDLILLADVDHFPFSVENTRPRQVLKMWLDQYLPVT